jgi:hypothetical protein
MHQRPLARAAALALALTACACSHLHSPWFRAQPAAPGPVHELDVGGAAPDAYPQSWKRNTLIVDLSAASGSGSIILKPAAGSTWPVRLALRVQPGTIGSLEVRGAQRISLPISAGAGKAVDLEIAPELYPPTTPQLTVSWSAGRTP